VLTSAAEDSCHRLPWLYAVVCWCAVIDVCDWSTQKRAFCASV